MEAGGRTVSLFVDREQLRNGIHGSLGCVDCHGPDYVEVPHPEEAGAAECAECHEEQNLLMESGAHGPAAAPGMGCADCHGYHGALPPSDPRSRVSLERIGEICAGCHKDALAPSGRFPGYWRSAHADTIDGRPAATCTDCHAYHGALPSSYSESAVNPDRIPATCGKCHANARADYERSVHGKARERGVEDAPSCTGCHGSHSILSSSDPVSSVYAGNVPGTCSKCHAEERITSKYGLAANRVETYESSFHGIANRYGEMVVANCASCHGVHEILPPSDPASSIAPENRAQTCGKCHVGAGENFARGKIHVEATRESSRGMFYVRRFYTWLIAVMVVFFAVHIAMDVAGYRRRKRSDAGGK